MKKRIMFMAFALAFMPIPGMAAETINAVYVDGIAPIMIDGDLSDWAFTNMPFIPIIQANQLSKSGRPRDAADLSAEFQCLPDIENIYIAVRVRDDKLVFGEEQFGGAFWDDCVELLFYSTYNISPLKIWFSAQKNGSIKIEGREPSKVAYPYLWQLQGVLGILKSELDGFTIEVVIPKTLLMFFKISDHKTVELNVRVYDDDDNNEFDSIIELCDSSKILSFNVLKNSPVLPMVAENNKLLTLNIDNVLEMTDDEIAKRLEVVNVLKSIEKKAEAIRELEYLSNNEKSIHIEYIKINLAELYLATNKTEKAKILSRDLYLKSNNVKIKSSSKNLLHLIAINEALQSSKFDYLPKSIEIYKRINYIDVKWGNKLDEVQYINRLPYFGVGVDGSKLHGGPTVFEVTNDGNVIIFDNNSGYIKIFDNKSNLVEYFSVNKVENTQGYLILDDKYLWIHNVEKKHITKYSIDGTIIESIVYDKTIPKRIGIVENNICAWADKIIIDRSKKRNGPQGENEYNAKIVETKENEIYVWNYCKYSGKIIKVNNNQYEVDSGLISPSVEVGNGKVMFEKKIFNEISPLYELYLANEDNYGNIYFRMFYTEGKKPLKIFKCDKNFQTKAVLELPYYNKQFYCSKDIVFKENGDIYVMMLDDSGVHIVKYTLHY